MQKGNNNKLNRIDEELKKELSHIISYELKNPKVTGLISVTDVKTTPDLKYAKVFVSILNAKNTKATLANLKKSAGFIRTQIAKKVNLRVTPEFVFVLDETMEYGAKIDSILNDIMKDIKKEEEKK